MKGIFLKSIVAMALVVSFMSPARGQQTNIHVTMPPFAGHDAKEAGRISAGYLRMHGEKVDLHGIDVNTIFRRDITNTTASNFTLGAALLGSFLDGEMAIDSVNRDLSSVVVHGSYNREYLAAKKASSSLLLFWGIPLSLGSFVLENRDDVTLFNVVAGLQAGARLGLETGDFTAYPLLMAHFMGGYRERYDDGVYLENLDSGGIPFFAVMSAGLEILYRPLRLNLSGIYQRTFESEDNEPMDAAIFQLGFSF